MSLRPSDKAWIALFAGVAAWDILAPPGEMLSEAVDRYIVDHPIIVTTAVGITAAHLLNLLDRRPWCWIDVFAHLARMGSAYEFAAHACAGLPVVSGRNRRG